MAAPENYKKLGTVGIAFKGDYSPDAEYKYANAVYYEGSTYIVLKDNPEGEPKDDGVNWKYFARGASGSGSVTSVNGKDGIVELNASDVSAIPDTDKGSPDGVASLDHDGKVPKDQFPDDIGTGVVSDKFSNDKEYAIGDYCIYNDVLYKFTAAKDAGPWDLEVVQSTTVLDEIKNLRDIVMDLVDRMGNLSFRAMSQEDYDSLLEKEENRIYFAVDESKTTTFVDTPIQILPVPADADSQENNEVSTIPIDTPTQLPDPGDVAEVMPSELGNEENGGEA